MTHPYVCHDSFICVPWLSPLFTNDEGSLVQQTQVEQRTETTLTIGVTRENFYQQLQPIAFGLSFNLNLESQYPWSLLNGIWKKRPRGLDHRLKFEI